MWSRMHVTWLILAIACAYPLAAFGQEEPSAADSVQVRAAMLGVIISPRGRLDLEDYDRRIWLRPTRLARRRWAPHSEEGISYLKERFPTLEAVDENHPLYVCDSGEHVRTHVAGCLIRDDGIIVTVTAHRIEGDTAWAGGSLTAISTFEGRTGRQWAKWDRAMGVRLSWDGETWTLEEITSWQVGDGLPWPTPDSPGSPPP